MRVASFEPHRPAEAHALVRELVRAAQAGLRRVEADVARLEVGGRDLRRPREVKRIVVREVRDVLVVLQETLLELLNVPLAARARGDAALFAGDRGGRAGGLSELEERGLHPNRAERDVRDADGAPAEEEVRDVLRVDAAVGDRVDRHGGMTVPEAVARRVLHAERVMRVEAPAAVGDAVGEHRPLQRVVRRHHVVADEAVAFAPGVLPRDLRHVGVRRLLLDGRLVLDPTPVREGDAHELVARALRILKVVEASVVLHPPDAPETADAPPETLRQHVRPRGRRVRHGMVGECVAVAHEAVLHHAAAHGDLVAFLRRGRLVVFAPGFASVHVLRAGEEPQPAVARAVREVPPLEARLRAGQRVA